MNEPNVERVRKYLENKEVQERIQRRMLDARAKATVTISRAAPGTGNMLLKNWISWHLSVT